MGYLIILVVLFGLMWLLLIRPQRRKQSEQAQMQRAIAPGDEILTAGGIHGIVRELEDEVVHVEIAPGTTVRLDRRAVAAVAQGPEPEAGSVAQEPESQAERVPQSEHAVPGDES